MQKRVFLGGTCNGSTWRDVMISYLRGKDLDYFNPVVDDWDDEARDNEDREKEECDFLLYTLTPKMTGVYAVAEVVESSYLAPENTVLVLLREDEGDVFTDSQWKSLLAVAEMVSINGVRVFYSLEDAADYMSMGGLNKLYVVRMPDGSRWSLPVDVIAKNRAKYFSSSQEGMTYEEAMKETIKLFREDNYGIEEWAKGNMDWGEEVYKSATCISPPVCNYGDGWHSGDAEIIDLDNSKNTGGV